MAHKVVFSNNLTRYASLPSCSAEMAKTLDPQICCELLDDLSNQLLEWQASDEVAYFSGIDAYLGVPLFWGYTYVISCYYPQLFA